ncbi:DUF4287 domain-containing protein [Porphyrobacter sp. ULC335]|uniref:DUF4287 domain-containing protein n=1 Tax=Porphyrobacter sp. ULC335 TaxID=2854260 RepID=UPI002220D106|nr:DUF4287 domain-containing protein [Porphyrobacter sp. ULC335]UYV16637.1 DUF4287 domain-containing protein [Porphyrobacter sp. ULC335]
MSFQAYLDTIERQTGLNPTHLKAAADAKGFSDEGRLKAGVKAGQIVDWLKSEHGLGHGHAMAVYALLSGKREPGN